MKKIILELSILVLNLVAGIFFLSLAAAARASSTSARPPAAATLSATTVVLVVGPLIELFLVIKLARDVTGSKGCSDITGLVSAIATYLQTAGKGNFRKLYPSKRRISQNYTRLSLSGP